MPANKLRVTETGGRLVSEVPGAVQQNRPGAVTYLKSPNHTLRGENGGSRLESVRADLEAVRASLLIGIGERIFGFNEIRTERIGFDLLKGLFYPLDDFINPVRIGRRGIEGGKFVCLG